MGCYSRQDGAEDGDMDSGSGGCRFETALHSMFLYLQVHRCWSGGWRHRVWRREEDCRLGSTKVHLICGVLSNGVKSDCGAFIKILELNL